MRSQMLDKPSKMHILRMVVPQQVARIEQGKCPLCAADIIGDDFTSALSMKEFHISGMCQRCQDATFDAKH